MYITVNFYLFLCSFRIIGVVKFNPAYYNSNKRREREMARPKQSIIEYRSYELPASLPLMTHNRMNWQISPVRSSRLHIHNCFEIGICLSGSGTVCFGEDEFPFHEGDVLFVGRNVPHTTWSNAVSGSTWKYIHIDPERLLGEDVLDKAASPRQFHSLLTECHLLLPSSKYPWAESLTEDIIEEASRKDTDHISCIHGLCEVLFIRLFRSFVSVGDAGKSPYLLSVLSPALEYINLHYTEQFPLEKLADECHLSPTHFRRKFQQQFGTNPLSYLHQVRIMKSCDLLLTTADAIYTIAEQVGYTSLSCYNRHFIEFNGCTPSEWRALPDGSRRTLLVGLAGWDRPETSDEIEQRNRIDTTNEKKNNPADLISDQDE
ncbi:MAG: AraC family transcriptional regulator [Clostridiales bacterium]|nr:AraC family transcriptional regulator [Clostridiales bacterium]